MLSESEVTQSCPTLCDLLDCSPPGSSVHGIFQARILEWVDYPFSRGSSQPRDRTQVSCTAGSFFTSWVTREAQEYWSGLPISSPADLSDPEIEPESPTLQEDSLPTELSGKVLTSYIHILILWIVILWNLPMISISFKFFILSLNMKHT